jgi:hypothetical protein
MWYFSLCLCKQVSDQFLWFIVFPCLSRTIGNTGQLCSLPCALYFRKRKPGSERRYLTTRQHEIQFSYVRALYLKVSVIISVTKSHATWPTSFAFWCRLNQCYCLTQRIASYAQITWHSDLWNSQQEMDRRLGFRCCLTSWRREQCYPCRESKAVHSPCSPSICLLKQSHTNALNMHVRIIVIMKINRSGYFGGFACFQPLWIERRGLRSLRMGVWIVE